MYPETEDKVQSPNTIMTKIVKNLTKSQLIKANILEYEKQEYSPGGLHYRFGGAYGFTTQEQERLFFTALSKQPEESGLLTICTLSFWPKPVFARPSRNFYA